MENIHPNGRICVERDTRNWERNLSNLVKSLLDLDYEIQLKQTDDEVVILDFTYDSSKIENHGNRYLLVTEKEEKEITERREEK